MDKPHPSGAPAPPPDPNPSPKAPASPKTAPLQAFHLPGLPDVPTVQQTVGTQPLLLPLLTPDLIRLAARSAAEARDRYLAHLPVEQIVDTIDRTVGLWDNPDYPLRRTAETALPRITGYAPEMVEKGLKRFLRTFRRERLLGLLDGELGNPLLLDGFRPRTGGGRTRAVGPRLTVHFFSGNVPGLPAQSLVTALLLKSASLGKSSSSEPLFAALFARSLAEIDPQMAEAIAIGWWPGGDERLEQAALGEAEAVIAYGGTAAIESLSRRIPAGVRFLPYGHKISFGLIGREALQADRLDETVAKAAHDIALWDQQGCVSPQVFYVEEGAATAPSDFARRLASRLTRMAERYPQAPLSNEEAVELARFRAAFEFREGALLLGSDAGTVAYAPGEPFGPTCLSRTALVIPTPDLGEVPAQVAPYRAYLQTAGLAVGRHRLERLADALALAGVTRLCPLGQMPHPPAHWHHDGMFSLRELIRWVDLDAFPEQEPYDPE